MQAIILAGGKGTRLKPYTTVIPKPLMPVAEMPILEIVLRQLKNAGVNKVILAVGYLPQLFEAIFGNGHKLGLQIEYSLETTALGTAGPLSNILDKLEENFLVMNGDVLTTLKFDAFLKSHHQSGAAASICTFRRDVKIDFGVVESKDGYLSRFIEKPTYQYELSMGVNALRKKDVVEHLKKGEHLDMPNLLQKLMDSGKKVQVLRQDCLWLDIGRHADYEQAHDLFETRRAEFGV